MYTQADLDDIIERIAENESMEEKAHEVIDYIDKMWQTLIIERARIETYLEKNNATDAINS